jgi:formylglycine-generating enzyme required for sulfatase activity
MSGTAPARNVGATIWIPTENEWFKAAYYDPTHMSGAGGYWLYANQSDSMSVSFANYQSSFLTNVGAYGTNADSYYGINDMAGNVWEWNDLDAETGSSRGIRNGSWATIGETNLMSSTRQTGAPENENRTIGFRLASIPEPSTTLLTLVFTTGLLCRRKRHA